MAVPPYQAEYTFLFRDCNGNQATMPIRTFMADADTLAGFDTNSQTVTTAVGNPGHLSNAKVVGRGLSVVLDEASGASTSPNPPLESWFSHVEDKARLAFANAEGSRRNVYLPAPIEAIFFNPPSDMRVNEAQAGAAGLIAAITALITDANLNPLNSFKGGAYNGRSRHVNEE